MTSVNRPFPGPACGGYWGHVSCTKVKFVEPRVAGSGVRVAVGLAVSGRLRVARSGRLRLTLAGRLGVYLAVPGGLAVAVAGRLGVCLAVGSGVVGSSSAVGCVDVGRVAVGFRVPVRVGLVVMPGTRRSRPGETVVVSPWCAFCQDGPYASRCYWKAGACNSQGSLPLPLRFRRIRHPYRRRPDSVRLLIVDRFAFSEGDFIRQAYRRDSRPRLMLFVPGLPGPQACALSSPGVAARLPASRHHAQPEERGRGRNAPAPGMPRSPAGRSSAGAGRRGGAAAPASPDSSRLFRLTAPTGRYRRVITRQASDGFSGIDSRGLITERNGSSLRCLARGALFTGDDEDFRTICRTAVLVVAYHYVTSYRREGTSASKVQRLRRV